MFDLPFIRLVHTYVLSDSEMLSGGVVSRPPGDGAARFKNV